MQIGRKLGEGKVAEVFEAGADVVKLYPAGCGPEQAQREASVLDRISVTGLNVPQALEVREIDGRWGLWMTRMPGRPLAEQIGDDDSTDGVVERFAALHRQMHEHRVIGVEPLKGRLVARIGRVPQLDDAQRRRLLERLAGLRDGDQLCHGDFHPYNIMADGETLGIIDWLDATSGPAVADVCRSYLLILHNANGLAEPYLAARLEGAPFGRQDVLDWLPVLAAARLDENVPHEDERLLALALR